MGWERDLSPAARRHPVCFRTPSPGGFSMNVQLPADARLAKRFACTSVPPDSGTAWAIVGLAKRDGLPSHDSGKAERPVTGNRPGLYQTEQLGGNSARAVRFACPLNVLKTGYNDLDLRQVAGSTGQQIVWVELEWTPGQKPVHQPTGLTPLPGPVGSRLGPLPDAFKFGRAGCVPEIGDDWPAVHRTGTRNPLRQLFDRNRAAFSRQVSLSGLVPILHVPKGRRSSRCGTSFSPQSGRV
ncbi:MAG: hypothetical protein Ct9H300mP1_05520 [Planctomycetaceae bacterium]|nr:MAG: hypothetical protein Ct9H300mP1_05520 [Planctomycetaceae bacterium]